MRLSNKDIRNNKMLALGFKYYPFSLKLSEYIDQANKLVEYDPTWMIQALLKLYHKYGNISYGYRTIFFDYAWAVYSQHSELWTEEELAEGYSDLTGRIGFFYPELESGSDDMDFGTLDYGEYFVHGILFCFKTRIDEDIKPLVCQAMFTFFEFWSFQYNEEIMGEASEYIQEWIEDNVESYNNGW